MTREEAIKVLQRMKYPYKCNKRKMIISNVDRDNEALDMAIQALSQEPCDDAISRDAVCDYIAEFVNNEYSTQAECDMVDLMIKGIKHLPSVTQKSGKCKNCKYFEYDSVAKVDGVPLIVAHEICSRWGDGCKTNEDGYCFLFEPQESEDKESKE